MKIETTAPAPSWYNELQEKYSSVGECPANKREFYVSVVIPYQTINVKIYLSEDEIVYDEHDGCYKEKSTGRFLKDSWGWYAVKDKNGKLTFKP